MVYYEACYVQFGKRLWLGAHGDYTNRAKANELLRFHASKSGAHQKYDGGDADQQRDDGDTDQHYEDGE